MTNEPLTSAADDPNYPNYFPPRDGGMTTLGAFWRHTDLVSALSTELKIAQIEDTQKTESALPVFGVGSFLARGIQIFVHDHPALEFDGKAVSDGSLVFIPRRLVETMNNLSFPPSEKGQRAHLLTWMAQATLACAHHALSMTGERDLLPALSSGPLDMSDTLPEALDSRNTLVFQPPSTLQAALKQAYASAASPLAMDELCGQTQPMDDQAVMARTQARVAHAVGQAREVFDQLIAQRFESKSGLFDAAEKDKIYPAPKVRRGWANAQDLVQHEQAITALEGAVQSLGVGPYQPLPVDTLNQHVFFYGSDAVYSMHIHADNMIKDPQAQWGQMSKLIKEHNVPLPNDVLVHISRGGRVDGKDGLKGPDLNRADIIGQFHQNAGFTQLANEVLINGATSNLWMGTCTSSTATELYLREVAAASLLGLQLNQHAKKFFERNTSGELFAMAFRVGGDAMCLDKDGGQPLLKTLRDAGRKGGSSEDDVALEYGNVSCARFFLPSLTPDQLTQGLLLAARNRHAIELIPEILDIEGVRADAIDEEGRSVAHLLLDYTAKVKTADVVPVLVKLLDRGLNPETLAAGYLAGDRPGNEEPLVGYDAMTLAVSQWQFERLTQEAADTGAPRVRNRRL